MENEMYLAIALTVFAIVLVYLLVWIHRLKDCAIEVYKNLEEIADKHNSLVDDLYETSEDEDGTND